MTGRVSILPGRRPFRAVAVAAVLVVVAACAGNKAPDTAGSTNADKFLFDRGSELLRDRKWITSREYFRQLVDNYPQSTYRADAKLGIADTYLGEGTTESYLQALGEYREFLTYYPTHERADYAQYKIGIVHLSQMRAPQRDQTETREAIKELDLFVQRYPESQLMVEAKEKLREAKDRLGDHEYGVGMSYFRQTWPPGAIGRFKALLESDPEYSRRDAVYFYLAESLMLGGLKAEALPYYERLLKEFEASEYKEQAYKRIVELKGGSTGPPSPGT
jgi:outer membrane protein assembly factor BamD